MSISIIPDTVTITTDDRETLQTVLSVLARDVVDVLVCVRTRRLPDGTDMVVLPRTPDQQPGHLYGAAPVDTAARAPVEPFPVIPYDEITGIHIYTARR